MKKEFIDSKKTPCAKCGEPRKHVIDFHHKNPDSKSFTIGRFKKSSFEKIENEINKCVCLCANCHREFHFLNQEKGISLEEYLGTKIDIEDVLSDEELNKVEGKIKSHRMSMNIRMSYLEALKNKTLDDVFEEELRELENEFKQYESKQQIKTYVNHLNNH